MSSKDGALRVGIGGPVNSSKTMLAAQLCKSMRHEYTVAVITNDICTREDALILARQQALPEDRILGVETGGCLHTPIRKDASINWQAITEMNSRIPDLDNLAATFSPDLADLTLHVISVCQGEEIPHKGGPGITNSDLLIINKTELDPYVNLDLDMMRGDTERICGAKPFYRFFARKRHHRCHPLHHLARSGRYQNLGGK